MPIIKNYAERHFKNANHQTEKNSPKFDFFLRYGVLPAVSDSSLADFLPDWYKTYGVKKITPADPLDDYKRFNALTKTLRSGSSVLPVGNFTETASQIKALLGKGNIISDVALCVSQCDNISVKKTNALISEKSVKSLESEKLPPEVAVIALRHSVNYTILINALKQRDLDIAFNAFLNEPQVNLPIDKASKCFTELLTVARNKLIYYLQ
jgi:alpha-galactosidase